MGLNERVSTYNNPLNGLHQILLNWHDCNDNLIIIEMRCDCVKTEEEVHGRETMMLEEAEQRKNAPLSFKIANTFGLKDYLLNRFVFRPKGQKTYQIDQNQLKCNYYENPALHFPNHLFFTQILSSHQGQISCSVPIILLKTKQKGCFPTLVYSHGNSSDLIDSLRFCENLLKKSELDEEYLNVLLYDYSGYGDSRVSQISESTLILDLETVVNYLRLPPNSLILWGFSLGSYPTVQVASKMKVGGVILQSPLASAASFLDDSEAQHFAYDVDCLNNLEKITEVNAPVLIFHSSDDEIIPLKHSMALFERLKKFGKSKAYSLIEVDRLGHNQIHSFLMDLKENSLNWHFWNFIKMIKQKYVECEREWEKEEETSEESGVSAIEMGAQMMKRKEHSEYFKMS